MNLSINLFRTDISTDITAHDLLKTFAIITMIIDHAGFFFFDNQEEMRLIGRLSSPVWFFLIGYALHSRAETRLWIWGSILLIGTAYLKHEMHPEYGYVFLPLNIIFMFLVIRLTRNFVMRRATLDFDKLIGVFWLLAVLIIPMKFFFEYGAVGYMFALAGYMARRQDSLENISFKQINIFMLLSITAYTAMMWYEFKFEPINVGFLYILLICMCLPLLHFKPHTFSAQSGLMSILKYPLFLTGRRTLEIYVLHLLIFMYIMTYAA